MVCIRCQKRPAIIFIQRMDNGQMKQEGYCLHCARELHIKPVDDLMKQFGMSDQDLDNMENRMESMMEEMGSEELRLLSAITPKGEVFYQGTVQALADKCILFRDDYGAVSRLLLELIRAEALARGYHIITCPCAMHPEDKIDHIIIPSLRLAFLTDNRWHPVRLSAAQTVRCSRFVDRENLSACRARLRFNERAAAELLEQACALMAQAKSCHDELETYYRTAVDFAQVDAAAAQCMELFGVG